MFLGEHEHTIDDKGRLTLPAKLRAPFAGGIVLIRGLDKCVYAFTPERWQGLRNERLAQIDPFSTEGRKMRRYLFSGAAKATLDRQGRVPVPTALVEYAGLRKDVVVAGVDDHLEIWDRMAWRKLADDFEGSAEDVAERLAATGH
jgi:transcriptional regulator MraZ